MSTLAISLGIGAYLSSAYEQSISKATKSISGLQAKLDKLSVSKSLISQFRQAKNLALGLADAIRGSHQPSEELGSKFASATKEVRALATELKRAGVDIKDLDKEAEKLDDAFKKIKKRQTLSEKFSTARESRKQAMADLKGAIAPAMSLAIPISLAAGFEKEIVKVKALSRATETEFKKMKKSAMSLAAMKEYSFSASEVAQGMQYLAMAGFKASDIIAGMPGVLSLATVGQMDLARASDIASDVLSGFGLQAKDLGGVVDVISKTITTANVNVELLGETMKYVAPVARGLGISIQEVSAMAGLLGNVGIKGSQAGTTLRAMMLRLSAPTGTAKKALEALGVSVKDASGNMRPFTSILKDIALKTEKLGSADKQDYFKRIFGEEPAAGASELISQALSGGLDKYIAQIKQSAGTAKGILQDYANTTAAKFSSFKATLEGLGISIGNILLPVVKPVCDFLGAMAGVVTSLTEKFPTLTKVIFGLAGGFMAMLVGVKVFNLFRSATQEMVSALNLGIETTLDFIKTKWAEREANLASIKALAIEKYTKIKSTVTGATSAVLNFVRAKWAERDALLASARAGALSAYNRLRVGALAFLGSIRSLGTGLLGLARVAIPTVISGFQAMSAALLANPIGLVVAAIGAACAGLYLLYKYFAPVRNLIDGTFLRFKAFFSGLAQGFVQGLAPLKAAIQSIFSAFKPVAEAIGTLKAAFTPLLNALKPIFGWFARLFGFGEAWKKQTSGWAIAGRIVGKSLATAFLPLTLLIRGIGVVLKGVSFVISGIIRGIASGVGLLGNIFSSVFAGIKKVCKIAFDYSPIGLLITGLGKIKSVIASLANFNLFDAGKKIVLSLWEGIKSVATAPVRAIKSIVSKIRNFLPFSPAKEGPLSTIDKSGPGLIDAFAAGISKRKEHIEQTISNTLSGVRRKLVPVAASAALSITPVTDSGTASATALPVMPSKTIERQMQLESQRPAVPAETEKNISIGPIIIKIEGSGLDPEAIAIRVKEEIENLQNNANTLADEEFII